MQSGTPSDRDRALRMLQQGDFAQSIPLLLNALGSEPDDIDTQLYLAYAYVQSGDPAAGIAVLEKAADLSPTSAKVHYNLGVAYQRSHNLTLAKDEYLRALGLDAGYVPARKALDALHYPSNVGGTVHQARIG